MHSRGSVKPPMIPNNHKTWSLLASTSIFSLATVDEKGNPHCSVLVYEHDKNLNFFFVTDKNSAKAKNILSHPQVAFAIVGSDLDMTLQGGGEAVEMTSEAKIKHMLRLMERADQAVDGWAPIARYKQDDLVLFQIKPSWLRLLDISAVKDNMHELAYEDLTTQVS